MLSQNLNNEGRGTLEEFNILMSAFGDKNRHVSVQDHQMPQLGAHPKDKMSIQDLMKQEALEEEKKAHEDDEDEQDMFLQKIATKNKEV